jgi:hypothetical protein
MRHSISTRKCTPIRQPIFSASSIIPRATIRVPGSVATTSSVARVSAERGLKQRLPHNLSQIPLRILEWILAEGPPALRLCEPSNPFGLRPSRAPGGQSARYWVPGLSRRAPGIVKQIFGSTVGHRRDALRLQVRELALESAKIPGNAVCAVTTAVSGPRSGFI